jgi:hypothetical protein
VIGDEDTVGAVSRGDARVLRVEHSLQHEAALPQFADEFDVLPGESFL